MATQTFLSFSPPNMGKMNPFWLIYIFQMGLKPPFSEQFSAKSHASWPKAWRGECDWQHFPKLMAKELTWITGRSGRFRTGFVSIFFYGSMFNSPRVYIIYIIHTHTSIHKYISLYYLYFFPGPAVQNLDFGMTIDTRSFLSTALEPRHSAGQKKVQHQCRRPFRV